MPLVPLNNLTIFHTSIVAKPGKLIILRAVNMKIKHLSQLENRVVKQFASELRLHFKNNLAHLRIFGSRARGEGDEESDIDMLVLLKTVDTKMKNYVWDTANDLLLETWVNISPLVMTEDDFNHLLDIERLIALDIVREGIEL